MAEYKLSYTGAEVNAKLSQIDNLAKKNDIPTKTSQLTNDSDFITGYTETDPTVPSWAKASTKPTYTKSEIGLSNVDNVKQYSANNPPPYPVTKVNNKTGAVSLTASDVGAATSQQFAELSAEIANLQNNELLVQNVAQKVPYVKVAEPPTFVDSVDEMTDTSKMYVLNSDGMFYSYKAHTITTEGGTFANFTNQVPISTDTDGNVYNGTGYKDGWRIRSGGAEAENENATITGYIPYVKGDKLYIYPSFTGINTSNTVNFYDSTFASLGQICDNGSAYGFCNQNPSAFKTQAINGISVLDLSNNTVAGVENIAYVRIGNSIDASHSVITSGAEMIITKNEEIIYTTTEGGTTTTYTWESTGISYNQPADYEDRVVIAEADIDRLEDKSKELTNRVAELEENGGIGDGGGDDESCYNVQMNRLYTDSVIKENTALNNALETLCNRRDGNTQSRQVITLKKNAKQKLILHLHKRENDGYDTVNDVYLPNAQNDFSDVRVTTDTGKVLKYQTVYSGNIDVISDSRIGNSSVSFLSDGDGNLYIGRSNNVCKSTDAGKTWSKIEGITEKVVHLAYVCGDGTLFFCNRSGVLFKSVPPYTTSRAVIDTSEAGTYTEVTIRPFQFVQLPTGEMLLGSYQLEFAPRIWKSTDSGETWTKVYEVIGGTYQHVHRMYVDTHQTPVAIYAGLDKGSGGRVLDEETGLYYHVSGTVLKSTDGGSTWVDLYADQKGKPQAVDHGVTYADDGYRLLGGETGIVGGSSIVRTIDDINFTVVLAADHAVYGPEKLNGYLFAGGCGSNGGTSATLYISEDEGITWKQIYSEEPNAANTAASAGIKTFIKGVFAGTDCEQLIAHNNCTSLYRPSKRIFAGGDNWYAEIIVDVPNGTNSITVESGYMCPNLSVINNDAENVGDAVFIMDFNENGRYLKEKVSGEIYKGDHVFTNGGKHLGYIYPDIKSATDMNAIKLSSPIFDTGIERKLNLNASELGVTISFWLKSTVNGSFEIISDGSSILHFDGIYLRCNTRGGYGSPLTHEGGRFVKCDIVIDIPNNIIKFYKNGICMFETTDQTKIDLVASLLTGEKYYTLLKRLSDDGITAIQHLEIRHGVPTDKEVYDSYFSGLTDNY